MDSKIKILKIPDWSDGDSMHRPTNNEWKVQRPANLWLQKLAEGWMEHRGDAVKGMRYYLDKLPPGYEVYERRRNTGTAVDKRLFGFHRSYFDSPNRFLPHFIHLMDNKGSNKGCPCTICSGSAGKRSASSDTRSSPSSLAPLPIRGGPRGRSTARGRGRGRGRGDLLATRPAPVPQVKHTDEEGTEDVYLHLLDKLRTKGHVDEPIEEDMSMDWRAENELLKVHLATSSERPMHLPRLGEIVLFVRNPIPSGHKIIPKWEAGVVAQIPETELAEEAAYQVNYTGYRVEPLPDPNSKDKSLSKQSKYVPASRIRPFVLWKFLLSGVPKAQRHPSIRHAITAMSTFSLLEKYHFSGNWPVAEISCKGIFIGSELVLAGDMVRIMPVGGQKPQVTDVLKVTSIRLKLRSVDTDGDDDDERHFHNTAVHITGRAYTIDVTRACEPVMFKSESLQAFAGYAKQWYRRHTPAQSYQIPYSRILGRLWETRMVETWLPNATHGDMVHELNEGLEAVREARSYSTRHLRRIPDGKDWFWADTRVEALDLQTINGQEVAAHDKERNPKQWRRQIKVLKGEADERERQALRDQNQRPLRGFDHSNSMISAAMQAVDSEDVSMAESDGDEQKRAGNWHRSRGVVTESSEDEDAQVARQLVDNLALPMDDEMLDDSGESEEERKVASVKRMRL